MTTRGIRGATTIQHDQPGEVIQGTKELLVSIFEANPTLQPEDIGSVIFTVSSEISSTYPAQAARELGWTDVPLLCAQEIPVPEGLNNCIRVLINWNTTLKQNLIRHIYLNDAVTLRSEVEPNIGL